MSFTFDALAVLAEIRAERDRVANPANLANPSPGLARLAGLAGPAARTEKT